MIYRSTMGAVPRTLATRARLRVESPLLLHQLEMIALMGLVGSWFVRAEHQPSWISLSLVAMAILGAFTALWVRTERRRVRVTLDAGRLCLRTFAKNLRIPAASVARLGIEHHPCCMRIVLCDGRVLRIDDVDARVAWAFEARVAQTRGPETFKLAGIPRLGRLSGWLSAIPLLSGSVRPRLRILAESLELRWGPFRLERPLCQLTRASATVKGVHLCFADGRQLEILTYGGVGPRRLRTTFKLNRILEERLNLAKQRALSSQRKALKPPALESD
jgi:hypothetical protein